MQRCRVWSSPSTTKLVVMFIPSVLFSACQPDGLGFENRGGGNRTRRRSRPSPVRCKFSTPRVPA